MMVVFMLMFMQSLMVGYNMNVWMAYHRNPVRLHDFYSQLAATRFGGLECAFVYARLLRSVYCLGDRIPFNNKTDFYLSGVKRLEVGKTGEVRGHFRLLSHHKRLGFGKKLKIGAIERILFCIMMMFVIMVVFLSCMVTSGHHTKNKHHGYNYGYFLHS